jgi:hypothetical protein
MHLSGDIIPGTFNLLHTSQYGTRNVLKLDPVSGSVSMGIKTNSYAFDNYRSTAIGAYSVAA